VDIDLRLGNCLHVLKEMEDNSVDSIVCDPPYGLHFMGSKWDYDVPSVEIWRECLRVLKHGGHLLAFSGTRTYHRVVVNIEDAGFEIRDQIQWIYGEGFPKSLNVGNGWGTQLKPANEPICLARKPMIGTTIENMLEYGTGAMNIDGCRIPTNENIELGRNNRNECSSNSYGTGLMGIDRTNLNQGRWPANVIHDGSDEAIEHFPETGGGHWAKTKITGYGKNYGGTQEYEGVGPKDSLVASAARYFYCAKANQKERNAGCDNLPLKLNENSTYGMQSDEGLRNNKRNPENRTREQRNNHPTVKPIALMRYLCRLITPPEGIVLDPFMGSGTTGIAACLEEFNFVGIELDEDYLEIARYRIAHWGDYEITESQALIPQKKITEWL
jgi:DNA modification methylase